MSVYKQSIMRKLDNILRVSDINDEDKIWIEAFVSKGLDDQIELEKLQWEKENGFK